MPTHITTATVAYVDLTDAGETSSHSHAAAGVDAAVVTYTPVLLADWDGAADPGDVDNALDQLAERVKDLEGAGPGGEAFPVGSVFVAVVSTDPATLIGYGTWSAIAAGRVLIGRDAGDTDFDTVEETGGAKTHTLTAAEMPVHTHVQDAHTHTQDSHNHTQDAHVHTQRRNATTTGANTGWTTAFDTSSSAPAADVNTGTGSTTPTNQAATATNQNTTATNQNAGSGSAHTNVQPYFVVYMWKRTA